MEDALVQSSIVKSLRRGVKYEAGVGASDLIYLLGPCGDGDGMAGNAD